MMSRLTAAVGALVLLSASARAGQRPVPGPVSVAHISAIETGSAVETGSIEGVVHDEIGAPVGGAMVSALGAAMASSLTDRNGRFELRLAPGPYLVRAHVTGFVASRGQIVDVRANARSSSSIALRRAVAISSNPPSAPVLAAGVGIPSVLPPEPQTASPGTDASAPGTAPATDGDDHGQIAWYLRHMRRSVLQEATLVDASDPDPSAPPDVNNVGPGNFFGRTAGAPARFAANFFGTAPFSGQLNLLTTSSFDNPQQLFSSDNLSHSVAYISLGAPAGSNADWAVQGAFTQADISSWVVAGAYSTRGAARHRYNIGLSYATQRYDGGNPAALRDVTDGSRNAGEVYGFDTFTVAPALMLTYGSRYARYDYLDGKSLVSPRVGLTVSPSEHVRISTLLSRRASAPGAEEFLPPGDNGVWLPPQRTFSPLSTGRMLDAERTTHADIQLERDLGESSTVSVRAFRQHVDGQLVTMFGVDVPGLPQANLGHYFIGNYGQVSARGFGTGFRTAIANRVRGSVEYSWTRASWNPGEDLSYWILRLPSATPLRASRIHNVATTVETEVPETSTRIVVLYRISNAFARRSADDDTLMDSRFDVQVRQSLPFMDFSTAKWEMLIGVRNFFREPAADQSVYDELLVVHPPKRIVGGLTMRF
jgi:TonB dependent receptor-like, beta-barrel/Carboxypeptidase regulatory-like domain